MLTIHHLGDSQSIRVVWLMEELGLAYELVWHERDGERLLPASYQALHPAATAPVVHDGERTLCESAVILEYICHKYADGRLTLGPDQTSYADYLYWMHFSNNALALIFGRSLLGAGADGPNAATMAKVIGRRTDGYARFLEQTLSASPFLAGSEFTCADIMVTYHLAKAVLFQGREMPNSTTYLERISQRPAYVKAMKIAGPQARPPQHA